MRMDKLDKGLLELEINPADLQYSRLKAYISELETWNTRLNLVSYRNTEELVVRHILDCLAGLSIIRELKGVSVADVGSGAGLPGLLLAIFLEDREFSLLERSGKKAGFLRAASALLGLVDRVKVVEKDLRNFKGSFDIVTMRAFREFGEFIMPLRMITSDTGTIAAYKGRLDSINGDLKNAKLELESVVIKNIAVPFLDEERNMVLVPQRHRSA